MMKKERPVTTVSFPAIADTARFGNDTENFRQLAAIVEYSEDAIISKSLAGTIKSWNKGAEKMFGYTASEVIGKNISLIILPEYIGERKAILEKIYHNKIIDHYGTVRTRKSGEQFFASLTVSPLRDREGHITGISKIARNITFRKRSEAEFIQVNREPAFQNNEKENRVMQAGNNSKQRLCLMILFLQFSVPGIAYPL